ncbi:Uma2 family endonuclease [Pseudanabaena sp. FACHB-2040]|uniref:Uma2 family endonuclease n=1 Tax=Pseudanabaena sp. FACHB-2040 TaxID=2692859 RepID=UPI001688EA39|nr:Uma2 family endonuclease [Pseudanabaena sp. FACHB-2040]MBD2259744.1 Uma2 family endonuclease [Pseudanabaena sp. FACHB-2040]
MVQAVDTGPMSFEAFVQWLPEDSRHYELHSGTVIEMEPTGSHELIGAFLAEELTLKFRQGALPYTIPKSCLIKPQLPDSGYRPDVIVLDKRELANEPLWESASTVQYGRTLPLLIEVVSTNWRDDYGHKLVEYEAMGVAEYWIVDYRALGAVRYIGKPKQPTITICQLVEGEYQLRRLVLGQTLESSIFPDLNLTIDRVFQSAEC